MLNLVGGQASCTDERYLFFYKILGIIKFQSDQLKGRKTHESASFFNSFFSLFIAKSIDFSRAKRLIQTVISEMSDLRNEQSVSIIYEQISSFCIENSIDLASKQKERRVRNIPSQSQNAFITSTIGHHANMKSEDDCRTNLYYLIIDFLIIIFLFCMKYLLFVLKMMIFFTLNQFNHLPHI